MFSTAVNHATISSHSSSSRSGGGVGGGGGGGGGITTGSNNSCSRNSSMPSLRMRNPLSPKTSFNPLFRHSDASAAFTSFDASHFVFQEHQQHQQKRGSGIGAGNSGSGGSSKEHKKAKAGSNPVLRRYHSHDSSTNFDDQFRMINRSDSKDNTPDSTKSRMCGSTGGSDSLSDNKKHHEYEARDFLERYSLPRVVRVEGGEPVLLYRCFDSFTKIQARGVIGRKGKERVDGNILHFPEGYSGWFSLTNEKGERSAIMHTTILQLVREQVCSFISMQPFTAYAAQTSDAQEGGGGVNNKVQYLKTQVRPGQLFQLRAVFQHKERPEGVGVGRSSTRSSSKLLRSARDKDLANRYAQLVSQNNHEFYVPLTAKGEFYEIHSSIKARLCFPGLLDKTGPLALDKDCLYKITHLLRRVALPVKVKLMTGPLPQGLPKDFTDTFILETKFQEPLMVTCTLPPPNQDIIQHQISCVNLNSGVKISKSTLGFDSENRLFKSQRLQAALAFCHKNVESWYREVRIAPDVRLESVQDAESVSTPCIECHKLNCEDCIKKLEDTREENQQIITKEVLEKFPKPKKWYKHFKLLGKNETGASPQFGDLKDPMDGMEKGKSIERYKDMSKLIEEKFGKRSYNPVKKSASFMFSNKRIDLEETHHQVRNNPALLKCQSLDTQLYSIDERNNSKSNISDNLSYDFQMCILEDHGGKDTEKITAMEEITTEDGPKLRKTKPDLIPTLPKSDPNDRSYITERLCSEFYVKTKVQKKIPTVSKAHHHHHHHHQKQEKSILTVFEENRVQDQTSHVKSVRVQVHETKRNDKPETTFAVDDIPYSHVADEAPRKNSESENIYAEICENQPCKCDTKICECKTRTKDSRREYCYVKLGSNGDSVTQSDSDEAIYNTLR